MNKESRTKISKFLSYVLRHNPGAIGLALDPQGWADIDELIRCAAADGKTLSLAMIKEVVATNNKQRFRLSDDESQIRANQGHSIKVDLGLEPISPPVILYHGTATRFVSSIREKGLVPGSRQHVHLSDQIETAIDVGKRHGQPIVLTVQSGKMVADGYSFYRSENGVWLTNLVPPQYLD